MPNEAGQPWEVSLSQALVRAAAVLVPAERREDWRSEWRAEIWHRWQFLLHTGEWNRHERLLLVRSALGACAEAAWLLASQESVRSRLSEWARSPFTCIAALLTILLVIGVLSSGFAATRGMLFDQMASKSGTLTFIWLHPYVGGGDKGLPGDVVPAWARGSKLLSGVAGMEVRRQPVVLNGRTLPRNPLVVSASPSLFSLLDVQPAAGSFPAESGVVLDSRAFAAFAHKDRRVIGSAISIAGKPYRVAGVLPDNFSFLSRQPTFYLIENLAYYQKAFIVARVKPGVSERRLDKELTRIAEEVCSYYYLQGQIRYSEWRRALLTPLFSFSLATLLAAFFAAVACRPRLKQIRQAFEPENRGPAARRLLFFVSKAGLGLACVFAACLEWSRSESSVLLASRDPGGGPFLLWLYVLGTMGVLFWALADQRARCRVCLRLMAFPVRIGCPGCLLLDWSGTELFCSEGHGLLHVPTLAPSWDEEGDRWVSLDDSWKGLFAHEK